MEETPCGLESRPRHMFTIYILLSEKRLKTYIGYTANLEKRLWYHCKGKVDATKNFRPWRLIYTEVANSIEEAKKQEKYWKSCAGRRNIKKIITGSRPTFKKVGRGSPK